MFTDRFLEIPISIYSVKKKELLNKEEYIKTWELILPLEIRNIRPTMNDEEELVWTTITYKNGDECIVHLRAEEFKKLLNKFMGQQ